jgi:predicted metal-dependent HD superfamily phosphohydrolase
MNETQRLGRRFADTWCALGGRADPTPLFARLLAAYRAPVRHYHTLQHIDHSLAWLDWAYVYADEPHEIAFALWLHDAVYEPRAHDNESQSAELARTLLRDGGVETDRIARIETMILATRDHTSGEGDLALLLDIDLAILGASEEAFARFEAQVREEYRMFDDLAYARGRRAALAKLAGRDPLYTTAFFADELGARARRNLTRAVAYWSERSAELEAAAGTSAPARG